MNMQRSLLLTATLALAIVTIAFNITLAIEKEIILSEDYQTGPEKVKIKERFFIDTTLGAASTSERLGYGPSSISWGEESKTLLSVTLHPVYIITPDIALRGNVPLGIVQKKQETVFSDPDIGSGIGDIAADGLYCFLRETGERPEITFMLTIDSDTAKYSSLGDGYWDFIPAVNIRKRLSPSAYQTWLLEYVMRASTDHRLTYNSVVVGAGLGWSGMNEVQLTLISNDSDYRGDSQDLGVRWTTRNCFGSDEWLKSGDISFFYYGLNHKLTLDANYWGVEYSFIF